jgi:uncharacterized membrane protein YphA (DoxX/SURF4 family)
MPALLMVLRIGEAAVFLAAGVAKLRAPQASRVAVRAVGVPLVLVTPLGTLLPVAELAVAAALLGGPLRWAALAAVAMTVLFNAAIASRTARGDVGGCRCFGGGRGRIGWSTIVRNGGVTAVALALWWLAH